MSDYTNIERETIINYNEAEPTASIYTFNRTLITRLRRLAADRPADCTINRDEPDFLEATVPKRWVRLQTPTTRVYTEAEKAASRERMAKMREQGKL